MAWRGARPWASTHETYAAEHSLPKSLAARVLRAAAYARAGTQAFHDEINETLIKETADLLVGLGLRDAGYTYVNIDGTRRLRPCQRCLSLAACPAPVQAACNERQSAAPVLADGWAQRERNGSQPIAYNATRFPNGIRALADYVHARGAGRRAGPAPHPARPAADAARRAQPVHCASRARAPAARHGPRPQA